MLSIIFNYSALSRCLIKKTLAIICVINMTPNPVKTAGAEISGRNVNNSANNAAVNKNFPDSPRQNAKYAFCGATAAEILKACKAK